MADDENSMFADSANPEPNMYPFTVFQVHALMQFYNSFFQ